MSCELDERLDLQIDPLTKTKSVAPSSFRVREFLTGWTEDAGARFKFGLID